MEKSIALYMFLDDDPDRANHRAVIDTSSGTIHFIGAGSREEAAEIATHYVEEQGVHMIELCGGFGYAGGKAVSDAVGDQVPVGIIMHPFANAPKIIPLIEKFDL